MQPQIDAARQAGYSDQEIKQYLGSRYPTPQQPKPQPKQAPKKRGGVAGFVGNVVRGVVSPVTGTLKNTIGNPIRQTAAALTGNDQAYANATRQKNKDLGLGEKGTDFGGGLKKFISNSAGTALLAAAPGASTIRGAAAQGAAGGAAAALGEKDSTLEDVITGGLVGGATGGALKGAGKVVSKIAGKGKTSESGGFMKNLTTQGQQAQARTAGVSAGSSIKGRDIAPQDTERMLGTLKQEGIKVGNANNTLRDITEKQKVYGKEIADHFKANNHPLKPEDTGVIASNFIDGLKTTDPSVLKQAEILANDLKKNVKSTKDMWEFRKTLDSRIPDTQFMTDAVASKMTAIKAMREYVAKELGSVPAMKNYHDLAEIRPFVTAEAKRLNNPGGGIVGRVLASGPVQKTEALLGKGAEAIGTKTPGIPTLPESAVQTLQPATNFASGMFRQGAASMAGGSMVPGEEQTQVPVADMSSEVPDTTVLEPEAQVNPSPFAPENIQSSVEKILAQGGTMKDVSEFLSNAKILTDIQEASAGKAKKPLSAEASKTIANANSGLKSLDQLESMISEGGVPKGTLVPGRSAFGGILGSVAGTTAYDTAARNVLDVITRLRTGAAISKEEADFYRSQAPTTFDPPETIAQKLAMFRDLFKSVANQTGTSGTDLEASVGG